MIQELDETIRELVLTYGNFGRNNIEISFDQPTGDWAAGLTRPTIDCYLYDLRENLELRSAEISVERGQDGKATKHLAPRRYDLSYLVTVWTQGQVADEHAVLWRVLGVLAEQSPLPQEICQGELAGQPYPIKTRAAQPALPIESLPDLWGVMENQLRPAINYEVTLAMEREITFTRPMVFTKRIRVGRRGDVEVGEEILQFAGIVHEAGEGGQALSDAAVTLLERGETVYTDGYGRYSFANVVPGTYHVQVKVDGRESEHALDIPATDHGGSRYDLEA
jgi:hypothetical protein